jgi:hypothetical protein
MLKWFVRGVFPLESTPWGTLVESQAYKLEGTQVSFLQTTLLSKASKIISIKCSLPKPVAKTIFQLDGTYAFHCISLHFIAFLSLVGFYFIEVKVANHKSAAGSSQFFLPVFSGCIYPTSLSIKWKFVGRKNGLAGYPGATIL